MKKLVFGILSFFIISPLLLFPQTSYAWIDQFNSSASVVIGQVDMAHGDANQGGSVGANTLSAVRRVWSDGTKLIVVDSSNQRVLIYNSIPTSNNTSADVVVGQPDFTTVTSGTTQNKLKTPRGVFSDGVRLYIADAGNNRVLIYNTIPTTNGALADMVIGQADFVSGLLNRDGSLNSKINSFASPESVTVINGKILVSDLGNHRVLIFNSIPFANDPNADVVIGQPDFITSSAATTQNQFRKPRNVSSDGTKLLIAEETNYRVLVYNSIPTSNGANADLVIGQADFLSAVSGTAQDRFNEPEDVFYDGIKVLVSEYGNNRVVIYHNIPSTNGGLADAVIGQTDFITGSSGTSQTKLKDLYGLFIGNKKLFITDTGNNRILIYNLGPENPLALINQGAPSVSEHRVNLTLSAEGAHEMMISNNSSFTGASWEPYATSKEWDLEAGNSIKTVYVKYRDFAQFESETVSASIELPSLPETGLKDKWLRLPLTINNF